MSSASIKSKVLSNLSDHDSIQDSRALAMRQRNQIRTERFLNARVRTMGIDKASLDAQVQEKMAKKAAESEEKDFDHDQERLILRVLEAREQEERMVRDRELEKLKAEWRLQKKLIDQERRKKDPAINPDACGLSAVQTFVGEDHKAKERARLMKEQMKEWVSEQKDDHERRREAEKEEEEKEWELAMKLNEAREIFENEEQQQRSMFRSAVQEENFQLANKKRREKLSAKERELQLERKEVGHNLFDPNEGINAEHTRENFRGMEGNEVAHILLSNEKIKEEKQARLAREKEEEEDYATHQERLRRLMEEAEYQSAKNIERVKKEQIETLKQQAREHRIREMKSKQDSLGSIGSGYYDGFGTSCR